MIMTQLPTKEAIAFETVEQPVNAGMRWTFPRRGVGLAGFPTTPLGHFAISYSNVTDSEVATLKSFFDSVRGRYSAFRFLDPAGNLLQYSEDFGQSYWTKTLSVSATGQQDPFGRSLGSLLSSGNMNGLIGPVDGGMSGFVMCSSVYVKAQSGIATASVGFLDSFSATTTQQFQVSSGGWRRVSCTFVLANNGAYYAYLSLSAPCYVWGFQVSPTKGESLYSRTPGNYGYHAKIRIDVDDFSVNCVGPNQNSAQLPLIEVF